MSHPPPSSLPVALIGIEGGATRSAALWTTLDQQPIQHIHAGPGNLRLLNDAELEGLLRSFIVPSHRVLALAIGLAGARTQSDLDRITTAANRVWPGAPCRATNDLETALAAVDFPSKLPQVLVLSGTGACCFGRTPTGRTAKVGGWGHLLGDRGSAYDIGRRSLEEVLRSYDLGHWPALGRRLLRRLLLNGPEDCLSWFQHAAKDEVAALAIEIFDAAHGGDRLAQGVVQNAADRLATDALACAGRLAKPGAAVQFVLAGGTLLRQPGYALELTRQLQRGRPRASVVKLERESVWGAVRLAAELAARNGNPPDARRAEGSGRAESYGPVPVELADLADSPTERRNPRSMDLDRRSLSSAIELFLSEEGRIPTALRREKRAIERACRLITAAFRAKGRLFYVGAGTSGRLGVLDASECPPTFRTPPDMVQGILAGGARALVESVEGAEDDTEEGARAIRSRGVRRHDAVVGIAASGRTPFVWAAMREAQARGARTVLVCFNPAVRRISRGCPDVVIAADVGPELLSGSTRLKAGTATKLILNLFTTLAMVRLGKVRSNLMIDLNPSNTKLRARAVRVVSQLTGMGPDEARLILSRSRWNVRRAVLRRPRALAAPRPSRR